HIKQNEKNVFFEKLYSNSNALRITMDFGNGGSFITGTAGCASFPEDADNYNDLFGLIDKMLYIGKNRGRNCYTIYDSEKHKNVEVSKIARRGVFTDMHRLRTIIEKAENFEHKLLSVMPLLMEILKIHDLFYVGEDGRMRSVMNRSFDGDAADIANLMSDDLFSENTLDAVKKNSPVFYKTLISNGFESALVARIRKAYKVSGYLVCAVNRSLRIWQENECAILYYVAGLLAE
ncbi:MAG: hypothetical protein J6U06_00880, partial [Spirochaetaceae bacterium]|nr:hypothetical protein [Spirochaetaceae bacterium]